MVWTLGRCGLAAVAVAAMPACTQIAGIADYRTGVADAGDAGDAAASPEGGDGSTDADASIPVPSCTGSSVALAIRVSDSTPGRFTGISDGNGLFMATGGLLAIGQTFAQCVPTGTQLDLQAQPGDPSDATHVWGGPCAMGRRCEATITQQTVLDVDLL
jgi:hypothetical protein